jgi:hypothetical protein
VLPPAQPSNDLVPALVLSVIGFIVFAALAAGLITDTFGLDDEAVAWVGAGLVGLGAAVLAGWAIVLHLDAELAWARRVGGDLLFAGVGFALIAAGLPTFAAGVI